MFYELKDGYSHKSFVTNDESLPQSIVAFDDLVSNVLNSFVLMSAKLHTDVKFIVRFLLNLKSN